MNKKILLVVIVIISVVGIVSLIFTNVIDTTMMEGYIGKQKAFEIVKKTIPHDNEPDYYSVNLIDYNGKKVYNVTYGWKGGSHIWSYVDAETGEMM